MPLFIWFGVLSLIAYLLHVADKRKETADERRTKKLVARAKRDFPRNALTESLNELYEQLYGEIVLANIDGRSIDELVHDRDLIAAETCRIWQEEMDHKQLKAEASSEFVITGTRASKAKKIVARPRKNSNPRQPAPIKLGGSR